MLLGRGPAEPKRLGADSGDCLGPPRRCSRGVWPTPVSLGGEILKCSAAVRRGKAWGQATSCPRCGHSCYNSGVWLPGSCCAFGEPGPCQRRCRRMPPKGKGKGKRVKQQKRRSAAESRAEATSRRAGEEADSLGEHPARWRDTAPWARADSEGLRRRLRELERALEQEREDKRDMHQASRLQESQRSHEAASKALAERDRTIAQLQGTMRAMESEYEQILHDSLDLVLAKLAEARQHWEEQGTAVELQHKQRLQEFGLNPLEM
ncbi:dynein regulatory complex protein 12 isoform X2 [Anas acuta]|uniref:dynein regulatory complex protein 12 isoform X2 n=1 Tax=Anas acuta TaxID=28680 RepID=UPI0035C91444